VAHQDGDTTDFGYQRVPVQDKARKVRAVFDAVAEHYDLMNDLMSLGVHRFWKRFAVRAMGLRTSQRVLDLAGGTGDLTALIGPRVGRTGRVVVADINGAMLEVGRRRLVDDGLAGNVDFVVADAERLPFPGNYFDHVCIAFGLRNVTRKIEALASMHRVLRPGGAVSVLEFSRPVVAALRPIYDRYSFSLLPAVGKLVTGSSESYRYLAESIRVHPDQDTLRAMMEEGGFERCNYHNLSAGIVALHRGYKL
jgi:demethylmenaquinone methyltransferase / 2-methoxy-6-polyprenyl-1,4-benzoquinol methylase